MCLNVDTFIQVLLQSFPPRDASVFVSWGSSKVKSPSAGQQWHTDACLLSPQALCDRPFFCDDSAHFKRSCHCYVPLHTPGPSRRRCLRTLWGWIGRTFKCWSQCERERLAYVFSDIYQPDLYDFLDANIYFRIGGNICLQCCSCG